MAAPSSSGLSSSAPPPSTPPPAAAPPMAVQAVWLAAAKVLGFAFTFLFPFLLVRFVDKQEFGLYRQSFLLVGTAMNVLPLGVSSSVFYFFPRLPLKKSSIVVNVLLFNFFIGCLSLAVLAFYPGTVETLIGSAALRPHAWLIGLVIFTWLFASFLEVIATANQDVRYSTLFIVSANFTKGLFMLAATLVRPSVRTLLTAALLQGLVQTAVLFWYLLREFPAFWKHWDPALFRRQLAYAVPLGAAATIYALFEDAHHYFVSKSFGPAIYASYAIGCFQAPFIGLLRDAIGQLMIARVSYLQHHGTAAGIIAVSLRVTRWLSILYLSVFGILAVTAGELIQVLYTSKYLDSLPVFYVNLLLLILGIPMYDPMLRAFQEQRFFVLRVRLALLAALIASLWFAVPRFGLLGAISSVVAIHLLERIVMVTRIGSLLEITPRQWSQWSFLFPVAAVTAAASCAAAALRWPLAGQKPIVILALCGILYAAVLAAGLWYFELFGDDQALIRARLRPLLQRLHLPA